MNAISPCLPQNAGRRQGVALVIVLAFVVLLTGLIVAFFSRSLVQRQSSNATSYQTDADLLCYGAAETVIGDLRQEIIDGSNQSSPVAGVNLYAPKLPTNMVPERPAALATAMGLENLVKSSGLTFSTGANAVNRASTDPAAATTKTSLNGHFITPARWNKPLLLAKKDGTKDWPLDPVDTFNGAIPQWVLVARDGSNPGGGGTSPTFGTTGNAINNSAITNNKFVVGRYAFTVYDEGGLLDMNAAGYPTATNVKLSSYKPGLAYADLKQLPGIGVLDSLTNAPALSASDQDNLVNYTVGIRNLISGDFDYSDTSSGIPVPKPTTPTSYFNFILSNPLGFLTVGGTTVPTSGAMRTDRLFTSRQDLIQFMTSPLIVGTGSTASANRASVQNGLRYLTHYTRTLNQPSVAPDPNRPKIVAGNGGNSSVGNDDLINPQFLNVRVGAVFTRNDGTTQAVAGEPLVKTRFALNRLAWLTYKGPIATDAGAFNADTDVQKIITELKSRGLTDDFLKKGGPTNISKYFGLTWDTSIKAWRYNVHNGSGSGNGTIMRLGDLPALKREPDFVELLKAAVNVGSIGKGSYSSSFPADFPSNYQLKEDNSTDFALIQLTANIIDQFDLDGYPTRIRFNTGGGYPEREFRGVENLPYFYRTRLSGIQAREANPRIVNSQAAGTMLDTGAFVVVQTPEIWNPHDQNNPRCAVDLSGNLLTDGSGKPMFPTSFRIIANSIDPDHYGSEKTLRCRMRDASAAYYSDAAKTTGTPPFTPASAPFGSDFSYKDLPWTADTTALEFSVPNTTAGQGFFREPTLLLQYDVPAGSALQPGAGNYLKNPNNPSVAGRLTNLTDSNGTVLHVPNNERYLGMYLGTVPPQWVTTDPANQIKVASWITLASSASLYATFRMQSMDPNTGTWGTYDEKYTILTLGEALGGDSTNKRRTIRGHDGQYPSTDHFAVVGDDRVSTAWDPRTARFGFPKMSRKLGNNADQNESPITQTESYGVLSTTGNVLASDRPDFSSGFGGSEWESQALTQPSNSHALPNVGGWFPVIPPASSTPYCQFGMVSQNNLTFSGDGKRWSGDPLSLTSGKQYYSDPDGIVRGAMGSYVTSGTMGLPMATATSYNSSTPSALAQSQSRPIVLNRPFRSVAELGYTFSGTPWKNLNFFTPESGDDTLLDVFCTSESTTDGVVAGKVNLNTRQTPVLQALLAGAYKDELSVSTSTVVTAGASSEAENLANKLVARTTGRMVNGQTPPATGAQPFRNVSEIVGRWTSGTNYDGFSADVSAGLLGVDASIQRRREAPIRVLTASGQTRVWNLMIDLVAQSGRYPQTSNTLDKFAVQGEQRYWVHVAIDRLTGQVINEQIEVVRE